VSNELVAEIRRLLGLPAADDDDAQDAATESEDDPGPVTALNGDGVLNSAASALRSPGATVTVNAAGTPADALRHHIRQQQQP
jgi:hypothetical protein